MGTHPIFESDFDCLTEMPNGFKIKKTYAKDQRQDACLRKIAFFNYEMENNIIMGRQIDAVTLDEKGVCQKKDFQNGQELPLDHPPNCGPVIKNIDDLPNGKVVSLFWNVFKHFFFRILLTCGATLEKLLKHL